jgi:hypothetical protein
MDLQRDERALRLRRRGLGAVTANTPSGNLGGLFVQAGSGSYLGAR